MARSKIDQQTRTHGLQFAKILKEERERAQMTQAELSSRAGIPLDTLRSIENGRILCPNVFTAADLAHALEGNLDSWVRKARGKRTG